VAFPQLLKLLTSAMLFSWEVVFAKEAPKVSWRGQRPTKPNRLITPLHHNTGADGKRLAVQVTMDWSRLGKASIPVRRPL
jgi:hypothetical protein